MKQKKKKRKKRPVVDEHRAGGGAVLRQLPVPGAGRHHGELDGVERVAVQDLDVETSVHHCSLNSNI